MSWTTPRTWVAGEVVTAAMGNTHWRDNLNETWHEVGYTEFTSTVLANTVLEVAATSVVSAGALTFSGAPATVEFGCPGLAPGGSVTGGLNLWDSATDLGRMFDGRVVTMSSTDYPVFLVRRLTPSAGSHTYSVRVWNTSASNFNVVAGAGGASTTLPGYIRIWQRGA